MTVRLTVERAAWLAHVEGTIDAYGPGLVPVVKGNGYGVGRWSLHEVVRASGASAVCVGTVHEVHDTPAGLTPVVLTPTLVAPSTTRAVLTVGDIRHVHALRHWGGRVMVKLEGSMRRYGTAPESLGELMTAVVDAGLQLDAFALHLPLAGTDDDRLAEVDAWLPHLPAGTPLWVSHLAPTAFRELQHRHPDRAMHVRIGTRLWHGTPRGPFLRLTADVLDARPVRDGDVAGYRHTPVPYEGTLVAIGGGTAAGIHPHDDVDPTRRSPFHFARTRLALLEPPHMHTSLVVVPAGAPCPEIGDRVDVQRPLTTTFVDEVEWT